MKEAVRISLLVAVFLSLSAQAGRPQTSLDNPVTTRDLPRRGLCDLYLSTQKDTSPFTELGDLATMVGQTLRLTDGEFSPPIAYEVEVRSISSFSAEHKKLIRELVHRSRVKGMQREYAAESVTYRDQHHAVRWTSNEPKVHSGDDAWPAVVALYKQVHNNPQIQVSRQELGLGVSLDAFHTHPTFTAPVHSAQDIYGFLTATLVNSRNNLGPRSRAQTHVIPLAFDGQIVVTFDPSKHRVVQIGN